jgi:TetR/AcrR family transcriptional regulator, transcriptional repressor for nem operon
MTRNGAKTRERILDEAEALVLDRGLAGTSIDHVLRAAETSKGAFFHHFPTKNHLARALVERYAAGDVAFLEDFMGRAEATSDDPAEQLVTFIRLFEDAADEMVKEQPSCLYVSYVYEKQLFDDGTNEVIANALRAYRERIAEKVAAAMELHPPVFPVEPAALADHLTATFEGAFVLTRALDDPTLMRTQLALVRQYVAAAFGLDHG